MNLQVIITGADVNVQNADGSTALIWASRDGKTEIVRLLLKAGANVDIQDASGLTAIQLAIIGRHTEIVELLNIKMSQL